MALTDWNELIKSVSDFQTALSDAPRRPVVLLGKPARTTDQLPVAYRWYAFTNFAPQLVGLYDVEAFGIRATLPTTNEWLGDDLFVIPIEYQVVDPYELWLDKGSYQTSHDEKWVINQAFDGVIPLEKRVQWDDNHQSFIRIAVASLVHQYSETQNIKKMIKKLAEDL